MWDLIPELQDHDLSRKQCLNQLSHLGIPLQFDFLTHLFKVIYICRLKYLSYCPIGKTLSCLQFFSSADAALKIFVPVNTCEMMRSSEQSNYGKGGFSGW
ncbi:unnamed protein product [Gulo gulo]|uniref:Uncharacterized protein n=1 Tax=Gulo gulo TaxID=48420 RepID=A0A9X9QAV1_GULGU|nr:unnamed protein product [Gulo gulo]